MGIKDEDPSAASEVLKTTLHKIPAFGGVLPYENTIYISMDL